MDVILKSYFPRYREVKILKIILGKIQSVEHNNKTLGAKQFQEKLNKVKMQLSNYLELQTL